MESFHVGFFASHVRRTGRPFSDDTLWRELQRLNYTWKRSLAGNVKLPTREARAKECRTA